MRPLILFLLILSTGIRAQAQQNEIPLQRDIYIDVERNAARLDSRVLSGLKPLMERRADLTNVMGYRVDSARYYYWLSEKMYKEHLLIVNEGDLRMTIDPLFNFEYGFDPGDPTEYADTNRYVSNTRGFWIRGDIGNKFSFQSMFHETQAVVPQYLFQYVRISGVMPGQGRVKLADADKLDFGWSQANISYSPVPWLNIQFGHGKHSVGHGYRSMLLSDNAINSPYLQFSALTNNKRFQYTTWSTKLMHGVKKEDRLPTGESSESLFYWYRARFNHLAINLGPAQVGLFEATLFQTIADGAVQPFDPLELNPVIGVNTLVTGFDGENKSLVGLDLRVKVTNKAYVYGQYAYDGRSAMQVGARAFDVLRKDLHLQVEWNTADRFMYMQTPAELAYMHGGQPMAHPLGTAFSEVVGIVDCGFGKYWLQAKVNVAALQQDFLGTAGGGTNLNEPDEGLPPATTETTDLQLTSIDVNASYLMNPNTNMRLIVGVMRRDEPDVPDGFQSTYVYVAFRTGLFNRYYDL
ncbi:MAG: hypothetical protein ABI432_11230 [Flavobacteriales bacterium]